MMKSALVRSGRSRMKRKIHVVLPAFNEEQNIGRLLDSIDEAMSEAGLTYQVLLVDDGSSDRTGLIASERSAMYPVVIKKRRTSAWGAPSGTVFTPRRSQRQTETSSLPWTPTTPIRPGSY